jgi:hypothetical protein
MPSSRSFLISLLACPAVLLSSALMQPAAPASLLDRPAGPGQVSDAGATHLLDQALALLRPERVQWLEVKVWQRTKCDDLTYQAEGTFQAAPGNRRRLALEVTSGRARGQVLTLCDGQRLYQTSRVGQNPPALWQTELPKAADTCEALFQQQGAGGPGGLLTVIRQRLQQPRREVVLWGGQEVVRITGEWPGVAGRTLPPGVPAEAVARRCRLYLNSITLWPQRVEWWGTDKAGRDVLLEEIEYRTPILNQPLSPERYQRDFTFPLANQNSA